MNSVLKNFQKGDKIPFDLGASARKRVVFGLRWDPMQEEETSLLDGGVPLAAPARSGATDVYDLDLAAVCYDKSGQFMFGVSGRAGEDSADQGNIYHTGDVTDGDDDHDDEQLILELFDLSSDIAHIFIIAEVQSAHTFKDINLPEIRFANAMTDENFAHLHIGSSHNGEYTALIFGKLSRTDMGSWEMTYMAEYAHLDQVGDWGDYLSRYVDGQESAGGKKSISLSKGEKAPLNFTMEARHRVICGLSWDPFDHDASIAAKMMARGENLNTSDLDLACVIFDADGNAVDGVSARPDENMDESGHIYHSGDSIDGDGDRDDEAVSLELKDMPDYVHHVIFVAEVQSSHTFSEIVNPLVRIADAKTNRNQLTARLGGAEGGNYNGYIFARVYRDEDQWMLHFIDEYFKGDNIPDLIGHLGRYLA